MTTPMIYNLSGVVQARNIGKQAAAPLARNAMLVHAIAQEANRALS